VSLCSNLIYLFVQSLIEEVKVSVKYTDSKTFTNENGEYSIYLPEGKNTLEFAKNEFKMQQVEITGNIVNLTMTSLSDVDLFELSFEELMNIKVTTAKKTEQKISEVPASSRKCGCNYT